jgi:hypothetical protein
MVVLRMHRRASHEPVVEASLASQRTRKWQAGKRLPILVGLLVLHRLIFQAHCVAHRCQLLFGDKLGARAHDFSERASGHEGMDDPAAQRFGGAVQRMKRDASNNLRFFQFDDAFLLMNSDGLPDRGPYSWGAR